MFNAAIEVVLLLKNMTMQELNSPAQFHHVPIAQRCIQESLYSQNYRKEYFVEDYKDKRVATEENIEDDKHLFGDSSDRAQSSQH